MNVTNILAPMNWTGGVTNETEPGFSPDKRYENWVPMSEEPIYEVSNKKIRQDKLEHCGYIIYLQHVKTIQNSLLSLLPIFQKLYNKTNASLIITLAKQKKLNFYHWNILGKVSQNYIFEYLLINIKIVVNHTNKIITDTQVLT